MGERKSQKSEVRLKKFEPGSGMGFCSWQWVLRRIISSGGVGGLRELKRVVEGERVTQVNAQRTGVNLGHRASSNSFQRFVVDDQVRHSGGRKSSSGISASVPSGNSTV